MDLILWRHAEAEDGMPDSGRKLTAKGHKQADRVAAWLRERLPEGARIVASPTTRTQQTAAALAARFETVKEVGLGASPETVLRAAGWPDARGAVVIVGHQPTLGQTAARILAGEATEWSIRKGAAWWFSSHDRHGNPEVTLKAVIGPDVA